MRMFQQRLDEANLIRDYGPAFAINYDYQDKLRIANIIQAIKMFHGRANL